MIKNNWILSLVELYLREHEHSFSEYELLTYLNETSIFDDLSLFKKGNSNLMLFYKHFLIMNALYTLQDAFWENDEIILTISPLKIERINVASQVLIDKNTTFPKVSENNNDFELKKYYLDLDNLFSQNSESIEGLLIDFWTKFSDSFIGTCSDSVPGNNLVRLSARYAEKCDLLGVDRTSTLTQIRKAYRMKVLVSHPDRGGKADDFIAIREAYEYIKTCLNK